MKKSTFFLKAALAILLTGVSLTLSGCSKTPVLSVAIVSNRENSPASAAFYDQLKEEILTVAETGGSMAVVVNDAAPRLIPVSCKTTNEIQTASVKKKLNRKLAAATANTLVSSDAVTAVVEECDLLSAIHLAANYIQGQRSTAKYENAVCRLMICDSGIATAGDVNFLSVQAGSLLQSGDDESIAEFIEQLNRYYNIPDLTGIRICWYGMAQSTDPQPTFNRAMATRLCALWEAVLAAGGAEDVEISVLPVERITSLSVPSVSVIPVIQNFRELTTEKKAAAETISLPVSVYANEAPEPEPEPEPEKTPEPEPEPVVNALAAGEILRLDSATIAFEPDSPVITNAAQARKALAPVRIYLSRSQQEILLVGSTASVGEPEACSEFGLLRAQAVKDLLTERAPEQAERITVISVGRENNCFLRVKDQDSAGNLTSAAALNRAVFVLDKSSEQAEALIRRFG